MIPKSALLSLAALPATQAFFLIPCWPLSTQRLDPLVYPGTVATHMHDIVGGNAFSPVIDYNKTQSSDCTSCMVSKDKSNYWVPSLYYPDGGSYLPVAQHGSASLYYLNELARLGSGEKMEPLPTGLRMLAGDADKRTGSQAFEDQAINYKCLNYKGTPTDSKGFPDQNCPDGLRAEVTFPSCWDGKNLDSADHKSHMAYPTVTFEAGACPPSHPHHLVTVKMEVIYETFNHQFSGKNPFVWSTGDNTGFGFHGDLIMGWDPEVLSAAVEQCLNPSGRIEDCAPFAGLIPKEKQWLDPGTCRIDSFVDEPSDEPVASLPGSPAVKLKGNWGDYSGSIGGAVGSIGAKISSAVGGIWPDAGSVPTGVPAAAAPAAAGNAWEDQSSAAPAVPSVAPAQFYNKAPEAAAAPAIPVAAVPVAGKVATVYEYVTVTTTVKGEAPTNAAAGHWNDAAKREEHIHRHRHAHARRAF